MARRVVMLIDLCDHEEAFGDCLLRHLDPDHPEYCPGGSRRVLVPGSYVLIEKVDGEWPGHIIDFIAMWLNPLANDPPDFLDDLADMHWAGGEQP